MAGVAVVCQEKKRDQRDVIASKALARYTQRPKFKPQHLPKSCVWLCVLLILILEDVEIGGSLGLTGQPG